MVDQAEVPAVGSRVGGLLGGKLREKGLGLGLPGIEHIVAQTVVDIEPDSWVRQG